MDKKARRRKMILTDPIGNPAGTLDVSNIPNGNSQAPFTIRVMQQCDLEHWHIQDVIPVPPWGTD